MKQEIRERAKEQREKLPFFIIVKTPAQMREHLAKYLELEMAFHKE